MILTEVTLIETLLSQKSLITLATGPKLLAKSNVFWLGQKAPPQVGAAERCFSWIGSCLTCKHYTRLERLARDKHSSLLRKSVNYGHKKFYNTSPR